MRSVSPVLYFLQVISLLLFLQFGMFTPYANAAPSSEYWEYWDKSNEKSSRFISHKEWQYFLDKYTTKKDQHHLVLYRDVSSQDEQRLNHYISSLSKVDPREFRKKEQFAYWVNLYNALTVKLILDNYPVTSITKLGGLFQFGPWNDDIITIANQKLSLNDIEHRILRPLWNDPRIHYVVNCASLGCPNLPRTALTGINTELQLEKAANTFINSPKGVDIQGNKVILSSIYDWYAVDFGNKTQLTEHIRRYKSNFTSQHLEGDVDYKYDWALNQL